MALGRRQFLAGVAGFGAALVIPGVTQAHAAIDDLQVDVAIIGGGLGGYAALRALCEDGRTVAISSSFPWFGGQLTSQGVPLDEHHWIESLPGSRLYHEFRQQLRNWYRRSAGLTRQASTTLWLDPGSAMVSRLATEPAIAAAVIDQGIATAANAGGVVKLPGFVPERVERNGDRLEAVVLRAVEDGRLVRLVARYFIDATELGDLLELGGVEHVTGAESAAETGEPNAPAQANPLDQQAITWCFAVNWQSAAGRAVPRPGDYDSWRAFRPALSPPWPGPLFSWTFPRPRDLQPVTWSLAGAQDNLWEYRRIRAGRNFAQPTDDTGLINWPQNDYFLRPVIGPGVTREQGQQAFGEARALSRAFLHWLQTEAPRHDGGRGYPQLQLAPAALGTADGFAMHPYIREGRRLRGRATVREHDVSVAARRALGLPTDRASEFVDTVGIGHYPLDLHPTTGGRNYFDTESLPFQIPWGALVPQRVENLLSVGLSIATTHLANGAYRTHATEFATGVAAGYGLAFCLARAMTPAQVHGTPTAMVELQGALRARGVSLTWPQSRDAFSDLPAHAPGAGAIWSLADEEVIRGYADGRYGPNDIVLRAQMAALLCRRLDWLDEEVANPFPDRDGVPEGLWRSVGILAAKEVAKGFANGTFGPNMPLTKIQAISFIARALVVAGRWTWQARPGIFPNLAARVGHYRDAATFVAYTGGIADCPYSEPWPGCDDPAPRWWFAENLHLAWNSMVQQAEL